MTEQQPETAGGQAAAAAGPDDDAIRATVARLARRHPSGGRVVERAAILAEGADCTAIVAWIVAHAGEPEVAVTSARRLGLHSPRLSQGMGSESATPLRYVLPADALA
jgi:hypothetical protein